MTARARRRAALPLRVTAAVAALTFAWAVPAAGQADRPMGAVYDWGHELNQDELPQHRPGRSRPVIPASRWYRIMDDMLRTAGENGLWFSGPSALPFPPLPLSPVEPVAWRTPRNFARQYRSTGLSWDVFYEVWAGRRALRSPKVSTLDPTVDARAYTQRVSLLDPVYRRAALAEIRRIVPRLRGAPYVSTYHGTDEPLIRLPRGAAAERTPYARMMRSQVRKTGGFAPPRATARATRSAREGLRWLAYNRWAGTRFFAMKAEQARLIRRLDPGATILPNDYGAIRGIVPWDYTRLAGFADAVETDPYPSLAENLRPGRGRFNAGFGAKLMSDLTGARTRVVLQAFPYAGYTPTEADLYTWAGQALRAGATDISLFASQNPRFTDRRFYTAMLGLARNLRGTRLPAPPTDPNVLVVYATASEGQGQPWRSGGDRYLSSVDELYTLYSMLGELGHGAFTFDSDMRLQREPDRLDGAKVVWLPRADTLDRRFAARLRAWVEDGGTLMVMDPDAFTRTPRGRSLGDVRRALLGTALGAPRQGTLLRMEPDAISAGRPASPAYLVLEAPRPRGFAALSPGTEVLARFLDGAPAIIRRTVGRGTVVASSVDLLTPQQLTAALDVPAAFRELHAWSGGITDHPAWDYRVPGTTDPDRPPWTDPGDAVTTG